MKKGHPCTGFGGKQQPGVKENTFKDAALE
jgi:hypothetical protein